eukprot:COSAG06_NODE_227_length_19736_cov_15.570708_4_plen_142_part_00
MKEDAAVTSSTSRLMLGQSNAPGLAFSLRRSIFCLCCLACSASCAIQPRSGSAAAAGQDRVSQQQRGCHRRVASSVLQPHPAFAQVDHHDEQKDQERASVRVEGPQRLRDAVHPRHSRRHHGQPATLTRSRDGDRESSHTG